MDYLNENIAINLRKIRKGKKMSLEDLAVETGLSKSMLGQIERGEANPTVATLGKIISGLRVGFDELVGTPRKEVFIMRRQELNPIKEMPGIFSSFAYFPYEGDREFEIYSLEVEARGRYVCNSHGEKTTEYLVVFAGTLVLEIGSEQFRLLPGDSVRLDSDKAHSYFNPGDELLRFYMLFTWR